MALSEDLDICLSDTLEELDETLLDDDEHINDPFLFDDPLDPFPKHSPYIEESKLNDFFNFQGPSAINLMHVNCRSIKKNFREIVNFIELLSKPLTAIAVTETWLNASNQDTFSLSGYKFISQIRNEKIGGGVGIFVNIDLPYKLRPDLCRMTSYIECLFIEIPQKGKNNIFIGCIYRPPNTDISLFNSEIVLLLKTIDGEKKKLALIAGDYNLDLIKQEKHAPTAEFFNNLISYSFYPIIRNPTRISNISSTLIDNIFVNSTQYKVASAIVYSEISDHLPIILHLETCLIKNVLPGVIKRRFFDKNSMAQFLAELANTDNWLDVYKRCQFDVDTDAAFECFHKQYTAIFNKNFPEKTIKLSHRLTPRHAWMTKGLIRACLKKSKLYKHYQKSGSDADKNKYKTYKKNLERLLNTAEKTYYYDRFKCLCGDLRRTWKLIGDLTGKAQRENISDSFTVNGITITDKREIVEKLNDYFVNIGRLLATSIQPSPLHFSDYIKKTYLNSLVFFPTDASEVINIVSSFKNKESFGFDNIPVNIMKSSICFIAEPISAIINSSMNTGVFPNILKIAKVCPVFKSGEKSDFQNYRPISVLPSFSKIFEKVVHNRLLSYLNTNSILCSNQYGFRKNHSTYMALMDMYDRVSAAADNNEFSMGVFIDLSKAFDTLNHDILLKKLEYYGVRGIALDWFKSYLSNRKQCVSLGGVISSLKSVTHGVPQGSILGPLLFILYINDIINCSKYFIFILFADDTNLFYSCKNIFQLFDIANSELAKLSQWFRANKLSLNIKKTNYILFGNKRLPLNATLSVSIDGILLQRVVSTKFLGIFVDEKLNWKTHIDHVAVKIAKGLGAIGRVRNIVPNSVLFTLYQAMIYPYLAYCSIIWGSASAVSLNRLVVLQNRAVRLVTRANFRSSSNPLFARSKLLKLCDIMKFQTAQFMFKVKFNLLPLSCMRYVTVSDSKRAHDTRQNSYFVIEGCRTVIRENSINVFGPRLWDSLPDEVNFVVNLISLKRTLLEFFCNSYLQ